MEDDSSRSSYSSYRAASSSHHRRQYDSDSDSSREYTSKSFHHNLKNDLPQYDDDSDDNTFARRKSKQSQKKNRGQKRKVFEDSDDDDEGSKKEEGPTLYCICRSPRMSQFMIACDKCLEWFHGECVKVTWTYSKKVDKYYCDACRSNDPTLEIVLKEPYASRERAKKEKAAKLAAKAAEQVHLKDHERAVEKENNFPFDSKLKMPPKRMDSDEERDNYQPEDEEDDEDFDDDDDDDEFKVSRGDNSKRKGQAKKGRPRKYAEKESKSKSKQRGRKKGQSNKTKSNKGRGRGVKKNDTKKSQKEHHRRGKHKTHHDDELDELKSKIPRHCFGPKCINSARKGSKYCSDECGVRLAKDRLVEILPKRIADWQKIPCAADKLSHNTLEEIRLEFNKINADLKEIDVKQAEFDAILEQGKLCQPYTEEESEKVLENDPDTDYQVFCFCCPQDVSLKAVSVLLEIFCPSCDRPTNLFYFQFLKHTERCFNKIEASSTYVSSIKPNTLTQIVNRDIFCNFYHPKQGNYCRRYEIDSLLFTSYNLSFVPFRLKVLCPEHFKDAKAGEDEVCGCPLRYKDDPFHTVDNIEGPVNELFCRLTRKKCIRHYGWEKVWQGGLDMKRLRLLWKFEELQYRQMKCLNQMNTRHGVLNLLLNRTTIAPDYKIEPIMEVGDE